MAEEDLVRLAKQNVETFNRGDWDGFKAALTPDSVYEEFATQRRIQGADPIVDANRGWKQAFPDAKGTVRTAVVKDNAVVLEITWEGTNTGPMESPSGTMPATGKRAQVQAAMVLTFQGDKIKETRHYFDMMGMLQQLGALPH